MGTNDGRDDMSYLDKYFPIYDFREALRIVSSFKGHEIPQDVIAYVSPKIQNPTVRQYFLNSVNAHNEAVLNPNKIRGKKVRRKFDRKLQNCGHSQHYFDTFVNPKAESLEELRKQNEEARRRDVHKILSNIESYIWVYLNKNAYLLIKRNYLIFDDYIVLNFENDCLQISDSIEQLEMQVKNELVRVYGTFDDFKHIYVEAFSREWNLFNDRCSAIFPIIIKTFIPKENLKNLIKSRNISIPLAYTYQWKNRFYSEFNYHELTDGIWIDKLINDFKQKANGEPVIFGEQDLAEIANKIAQFASEHKRLKRIVRVFEQHYDLIANKYFDKYGRFDSSSALFKISKEDYNKYPELESYITPGISDLYVIRENFAHWSGPYKYAISYIRVDGSVITLIPTRKNYTVYKFHCVGEKATPIQIFFIWAYFNGNIYNKRAEFGHVEPSLKIWGIKDFYKHTIFR